MAVIDFSQFKKARDEKEKSLIEEAIKYSKTPEQIQEEIKQKKFDYVIENAMKGVDSGFARMEKEFEYYEAENPEKYKEIVPVYEDLTKYAMNVLRNYRGREQCEKIFNMSKFVGDIYDYYPILFFPLYEAIVADPTLFFNLCLRYFESKECLSAVYYHYVKRAKNKDESVIKDFMKFDAQRYETFYTMMKIKFDKEYPNGAGLTRDYLKETDPSKSN